MMKTKSGTIYAAFVVSQTDYLAYGQAMPDRSYNTSAQRYTFNGKEDEIFSDRQDYGFRNYDKKQRRFTSVDPLTAKYPELTPFQFASNRPIDGIDLDGLEYTRCSNAHSDHAVDMTQAQLKYEMNTLDFKLKNHKKEIGSISLPRSSIYHPDRYNSFEKAGHNGLKYFAYTRISLLTSGRIISGLLDFGSQTLVNTVYNQANGDSWYDAFKTGVKEVNLTSTAMATVFPQAKISNFTINNSVANSFQFSVQTGWKTLLNDKVTPNEFLINTSLAVIGNTSVQITGFAFSRSLSTKSNRIANNLINFKGLSPLAPQVMHLRKIQMFGEIGKFTTGGNVGTGVANTLNNSVGKLNLPSYIDNKINFFGNESEKKQD